MLCTACMHRTGVSFPCGTTENDILTAKHIRPPGQYPAVFHPHPYPACFIHCIEIIIIVESCYNQEQTPTTELIGILLPAPVINRNSFDYLIQREHLIRHNETRSPINHLDNMRSVLL